MNRLFVAIELPPAVTAATARLASDLRNRVVNQAPVARVTWVAPAQMHLTLQFIGEVETSRAAALDAAMSTPFDLAPFEIVLGGAGVFPAGGRPRVIWVGISAGGAWLRILHDQVGSRLRTAGIRPEARPFHPHVTIGRVRRATGLRPDALREGLVACPLGQAPVNEVLLFESLQGGDGPRYLVRHRTRLRAD